MICGGVKQKETSESRRVESQPPVSDCTTYFDDGGDELLEEVVAQQRGPVVVDEVDQKPLDVRPILVLSTLT